MINIKSSPSLTLIGTLSVAALSLAFSTPAEAIIVISGVEVGNNVVFSYTGTLNTDGLGTPQLQTINTNNIIPSFPGVSFAGLPAFSGPDINIDRYLNPILPGSPTSFGSGGVQFANVGNDGDPFTFAFGSGINRVEVPRDYNGTSTLSGSMTFNNTTLANLGVTSGQTFVWTLSNGDTINLTGGVPVPLESDALPIVGSALFMVGGLWWKKKRAQAKAADPVLSAGYFG